MLTLRSQAWGLLLLTPLALSAGVGCSKDSPSTPEEAQASVEALVSQILPAVREAMGEVAPELEAEPTVRVVSDPEELEALAPPRSSQPFWSVVHALGSSLAGEPLLDAEQPDSASSWQDYPVFTTGDQDLVVVPCSLGEGAPPLSAPEGQADFELRTAMLPLTLGHEMARSWRRQRDAKSGQQQSELNIDSAGVEDLLDQGEAMLIGLFVDEALNGEQYFPLLFGPHTKFYAYQTFIEQLRLRTFGGASWAQETGAYYLYHQWQTGGWEKVLAACDHGSELTTRDLLHGYSTCEAEPEDPALQPVELPKIAEGASVAEAYDGVLGYSSSLTLVTAKLALPFAEAVELVAGVRRDRVQFRATQGPEGPAACLVWQTEWCDAQGATRFTSLVKKVPGKACIHDHGLRVFIVAASDEDVQRELCEGLAAQLPTCAKACLHRCGL